jgi:LysR family glycine cleavage system transcriptional activator
VKWLSPRLGGFWTAHPEIELRLIHTTKTVDFFNERMDLAIEWCRGERSGINHSLLIKGELTPVLSPNLPEAQRIAKPGDLFKYTLLRETDYNSWQDWFALTNEKYQSPAHTLFIDDSNVRYQAALDGQGVELSCRSLIRADIDAGRLLCPFEQSLTSFSYYLAEPEDREPTPAAKKFVTWLKHEASKD